ncbi:hypothetical protein TWF281_001008 [Arthrobotrys megalospora]
MRICAFQSSYEGSDDPAPIDKTLLELDGLTCQHLIKTAFIRKATAKQQIDAAVAEGYDFYINMMGGTTDDPIVGIEETRYLQTLALRIIGVKTQESKIQPKNSDANAVAAPEPNNFSLSAGYDSYYSVTVIEMGVGSVALNPYICQPRDAEDKAFPGLGSNVALGTSSHLLDKSNNPKLFEQLQTTAMEAFHVSNSRGNNMGCDVDIQVQADGELVVLEVNPLPAPFSLRKSSQNVAIKRDFPGGYLALINTFITNQTIRHPLREVMPKVANVYDKLVDKYDTWGASHSQMYAGTFKSIDGFDFSGISFDLACGTGVFGRALAESKAARGDTTASHIIGFDISADMKGYKIASK